MKADKYIAEIAKKSDPGDQQLKKKQKQQSILLKSWFNPDMSRQKNHLSVQNQDGIRMHCLLSWS